MSTSEDPKLLQKYHDTVAAQSELLGVTAYNKFYRGNSSSKASAAPITEQFKSKGLNIREGRWTIQEKRQLNENFEKFVETHAEEIGDPVDFIIISDDKSRAHEVRRLKKELSFHRCLSNELFREPHIIVNHLANTLDPLAVSNGQRYTVEDLHLLKSLVDKHGRHWKMISQEMDRSVASLQSAHRNFFLHEGYARLPPTVKQQKKLLKEMRKHFPDTDFSSELVKDVPWNEIANKIGHMHGKYLCSFWESKVKYVDDKGKLRLKQPVRPPAQLIRKFIRHAARQQPTHLDGLDWAFYYKMLAGYVPGVMSLKAIIPSMLRKYKIDTGVVPFPEAVAQLHKYMKRTKKLGFQSIWKEISVDSVKFVRWQQFHWALSPNLAHYVHDSHVMYRGFEEDDVLDSIKQETMDIDEVW